jgi:ElaB/YqjD/DUF883 family membrane-anchored ribosome-binding protein
MDDKAKGMNVERTAGRSDEYISGREALDTDGRIGERGTSRIPDHARTTTPSSSSVDAPGEARTREIRAEIERTRGDMSETVNAIQDRLRPGNIASNAAESVKSTVRNVTSDTARDVADKARDMADSEPVQYVRANPIPTAMIGIGIAGLTWLALGGREARSHVRDRNGRSSRDRRPAPYDEGDRYYRGSAGQMGYTAENGYDSESGFGDAGFGEAGYPAGRGYETGAARTANPAYRRPDAGSHALYGADRSDYDRYSSGTGQARRRAEGVSRRAQETTRDAARTVQRTWQENPLLMGAASAVLGLMVGMAVPQTEVENEYMGEARDNAVEGIQQTVRETVHKVQDAATGVVGLTGGEDRGTAGRQPRQPGSQAPQDHAGQRRDPGDSIRPPRSPGIV